jgi:hypothetical protein
MIALQCQVDTLACNRFRFTFKYVSAATVALLRAPFGRPVGLPLWPGLYRVSFSRIPATNLLFQGFSLADQYLHTPQSIPGGGCLVIFMPFLGPFPGEGILAWISSPLAALVHYAEITLLHQNPSCLVDTFLSPAH